MKIKTQVSCDKNEKLTEDTINMLFRDVFPYLSNLVIFSLAHFCECGQTNVEGQFQTVGDGQFWEALGHEAFRRGLVTRPKFSIVNVDVDKFSQRDLDQAAYWFDNGPDWTTLEDSYAEFVLGHDRYSERNES
ncbi:MAG TPA: hypothetical protein VMH20_20370 [Verrucomicrobiae bacterium]|nr:hypothetical protein [Verrucomicrobiae bacterium]